MSLPIRAVVFDFGGVLISPLTTLLAEVAEWHDVSMEEMLRVLIGPRETSTADHPWHRAERGELASAEMQTEVAPFAEAAGLTLRGDEYERVLSGEFIVHDAMIDRLSSLRAEGYRLGLLTNSFVEFRKQIESHVDLDLFDVVVDSSEVGHRKPEPAIYDLMTRMLDVPPEQIVYLDDFAANVEGARAAGWHTIHVTDVDSALRELDLALIPTN